jgi:hypothetical protein
LWEVFSCTSSEGLDWIQITGIRGADATKKYPHRPYADGGVAMKEVLNE